MRLLFCNFEYPPLGGGGGVVNAWLAEALACRHEVTVLTSAGPGLAREEQVNGVRVIRVPVWFRRRLQTANLASMAAYVVNGVRIGQRLLKQQQFDIINTHFVVPTGPVGHMLSRLGTIPNVLSVHGGDLYDPSKFMSPHRHRVLRSVVRQLLRSADGVVAQSGNTRDNVRTYYDDTVPTELIPLGIPRPQIPERDRAALGVSEDEFVMVTVGRLVARKAVNQLISIMASTAVAHTRLVIIGDGPQREQLEAQAATLGVAERVRFVGNVDDDAKYAWLAAADAFVSTSQHEGFGLVFLEAMAASLPVICYDNGGQTDFLRDGETGFVVGLNRESDFADAIERLYREPAIRARQAASNRALVEQYFIDSCAQRYEALFERVVAERQALAAASGGR